MGCSSRAVLLKLEPVEESHEDFVKSVDSDLVNPGLDRHWAFFVFF